MPSPPSTPARANAAGISYAALATATSPPHPLHSKNPCAVVSTVASTGLRHPEQDSSSLYGALLMIVVCRAMLGNLRYHDYLQANLYACLWYERVGHRKELWWAYATSALRVLDKIA